jgi:hypothetical protein
MKLALAGIGAGLGAMYLGNEGKGETFTSYPFPSRGKRLLNFEQVAYSEKALEKYNLNPPGRTPNADKIIEMAHNKLSKNESIHPSLAKVILELVPEHYGEDLAETIYEYQQFLTGQWGIDHKGRSAKGSLHLNNNMTPEQYLMKIR